MHRDVPGVPTGFCSGVQLLQCVEVEKGSAREVPRGGRRQGLSSVRPVPQLRLRSGLSLHSLSAACAARKASGVYRSSAAS